MTNLGGRPLAVADAPEINCRISVVGALDNTTMRKYKEHGDGE
jgi:hypothetical protein